MFANYKLLSSWSLHLVAGTVPWGLLHRGCASLKVILFTAPLWVWITISFTHPHSSVAVCKSPDCFSDNWWRCVFHLYFCSGAAVGFVGQRQQIWKRFPTFLRPQQNTQGEKKICLLHHKSFSTLAYRRRYQPLWLIPFHNKHMLFHLLWQAWSKPHQFCHWVWTSMTSENQIRKSWFDSLPLITSGQWVRAITEQIFLLPSLTSLAPHPKP